MTPSNQARYLAHAKDVMGWDEAKIKRNFHAITTGRVFSISKALDDNQVRQDKAIKSDAQISENKARYGDPFSTKQGIAWLMSKGFEIMGQEETIRAGHKTFRKDLAGGWDAIVFKGGKTFVFQFLTTSASDLKAHIVKLDPQGKAMKKAEKIGASRWMAQFERGDPLPRRVWFWQECTIKLKHGVMHTAEWEVWEGFKR